MDQRQVQIRTTQPFDDLNYSLIGLLLALLLRADFAGDEDLFASQPRLLQGLFDIGFVPVDTGSVDVSVARLERMQGTDRAFLAPQLVRTIPHQGYLLSTRQASSRLSCQLRWVHYKY